MYVSPSLSPASSLSLSVDRASEGSQVTACSFCAVGAIVRQLLASPAALGYSGPLAWLTLGLRNYSPPPPNPNYPSPHPPDTHNHTLFY